MNLLYDGNIKVREVLELKKGDDNLMKKLNLLPLKQAVVHVIKFCFNKIFRIGILYVSHTYIHTY